MPTPLYRLECVARDQSPVSGLEDGLLSSVQWDLNGPGSIVYQMSQNSEFIGAPEENVNEVQLWVPDGSGGESLIAQGFHHKTKETPRVAEFTCPGLLGYFGFRFITNTSLEYDSIEQLTIAAGIVSAVQSADAYQSWNIGIYGYTSSATPRSRLYDRADHARVSDLLAEFPTLTDAFGGPTGFDMDIDITTNPGQRLFRPYFPLKGTTHNEVELEWGKNITDFTVNKDGSRMANRIYTTGGSNGDIKFENEYLDTDSAAIYGEWQDIVADSNEDDVNVLLARSAWQVTKRKQPVVTCDVTCVEIPDKLLGVIATGDNIKVIIDCGRTQVNKYYRITSITWLPGPGNLKVTFQDPLT